MRNHPPKSTPPGLVPCGNNIDWRVDGSYIRYSGECTVCDLAILGMNILNFLIVIMIAVAALIFVQAGWLYITSPSNPGNIARAHKLFTSTLMGIIIILAAYLLIDTVMRSLISGSLDTEAEISGFGPWNEILCEGGRNSTYFIPVLGSINLTASVLVLPKLDCDTVRGTCVGSASQCGSGSTPRTDTSCSGATPICCTTADVGNTCTARVGSISYPGHCYPSACPDGQLGATSGDCTGGSTCCYQPVSDKGTAIVACAETFKAQGCIYSKENRNGCRGTPGYTDCSDLAYTCYDSAHCASPGHTTLEMYNRSDAVLVTSIQVSTLKPGDLVVYRYPDGTGGHVVICMNDGCSTSIAAAGTGRGILIQNAGSHLSKDGAKIIRASGLCP